MKKSGLITAAIITVACLIPNHAQADTWYGQVFKSPTGNLVCKYSSGLDSIQCGRWNDKRVVAMTSYGYPREGWRMDWRGLSVHTLYYGQQYRGVGSHITCGSYFNGVRCTNWRGHGFFISREYLNRW